MLIERERIIRTTTVWSCGLSSPIRELRLHASKSTDPIRTIPGHEEIKDSKGGPLWLKPNPD